MIGLITVSNLLSPSCSAVPSGINVLADDSLGPAEVFALACSGWVFNPLVSESNLMCSCLFFLHDEGGQLDKTVFFFHSSSHFLIFLVRYVRETQSWVWKTELILFFSALLKMPNPRGVYICACEFSLSNSKLCLGHCVEVHFNRYKLGSSSLELCAASCR